MAEQTNFDRLLHKIAIEQGIIQPDIQVKDLSTGGANLTSNLRLATITDKTNNKSLKLFAKIAAMSETFRESSKFRIYNVERIAYTKIFQTYTQIEEKHEFAEEHKLVVPKFYGVESTYLQETVVLEDFGSRGFGLYSRFKSVDWPYTSAAITELAKFHALSFAYRRENPEEFQDILKGLCGIQYPDSEDIRTTFSKMVQLAMSEVKENNKEKLKKFLNGKDMMTINGLATVLKHTVLVHGDFRPSNMLHRKRDDGSIEVIPVDYQTVHGGCPASDLVYFIVCATDGLFRAQYYQALIDHYYSELTAALARLGLDVRNMYPREDFEFELKQKLPYGLLFSLLLLPILTTPEDQAPKAEEMSFNLDIQGGDLYSSRLNELIDDYVAWGVLVD